MEMRHLKYFVTVAVRQNFTRAAEELRRSRPFVMVGHEKPADGQIRMPEAPSQSPKEKGENRQNIKNNDSHKIYLSSYLLIVLSATPLQEFLQGNL